MEKAKVLILVSSLSRCLNCLGPFPARLTLGKRLRQMFFFWASWNRWCSERVSSLLSRLAALALQTRSGTNQSEGASGPISAAAGLRRKVRRNARRKARHKLKKHLASACCLVGSGCVGQIRIPSLFDLFWFCKGGAWCHIGSLGAVGGATDASLGIVVVAVRCLVLLFGLWVLFWLGAVSDVFWFCKGGAYCHGWVFRLLFWCLCPRCLVPRLKVF